ncbi:MAG TPA: thioredoxin family protein [Bacteroidales bacterium]|nr:thioredoxin family protein [Bacteroidales bacterium]
MKFKITIAGFVTMMFLVFSSETSFSQIKFSEITNESEWNQLTEQAQKAGKPIFLDVYATWCGPCKYLEKNVYTNPELGTYFNDNYINAKMDGETDFGSTFARSHQLEAYPTMFFLTPASDVIAKIVGVREAGPLEEIGKTVVENSGKLAYYDENFSKNKLSLDELQKYQSILVTLGQDDKAAEVGAAILPSLSEEDIMNPQYKDIILAATPDIDSKVFKVLKANKSRLEQTWSKEELNQLFGSIFNRTLSEAIADRDTVLRDRIINELLPVYLESQEDINSGALVTRKIYLANTGQWKKYADLVNNEYIASHKGDSKFLYSEAYEVASNYSYSEDAIGYALAWVNQALELDHSFDNVVLAAYINAIKGNFDQANTYVTEADKMEKTDDQARMLTELKKVIDQAEAQAKQK